MKTFDDILREGLNSGVVKAEEISAINFESEKEVYDWYAAIEALEDRDIKIIY